MIARIAASNLPNVEARVMDGQALALEDASFDAVFSIFGVIMFPGWRKGLAAMARVTRTGGHGVIATWREHGAATRSEERRVGKERVSTCSLRGSADP